MDERLRFVARLLEGEKMAPLCAEFGTSRKTGYKIFDRYKDCGLEALTDRSRRPYRQANRLPAPIEATIVRVKRKHPGGGGRPKSGRSCGSTVPGCRSAPPSARCTRCSTDTGWSSDAAGAITARRRHSSRVPPTRTRCGVPPIKANSCSAIGGTAIRSPSRISPAATSWPATRCRPPRPPSHLPSSSVPSRIVACPWRFGPTTGDPSRRRPACIVSAHSPSGGCA